ncbi:MAG TPA: DoxX family protein [Gemmatimonadaceae bacterium]|nr:DoxX family protein [Gemmatimonadaceae bacterium]
MSVFSTPSARQINIGLTILRLAVGAIFIAHGGQKIFIFGFDGVAGSFAKMGIPMAEVVGPFVALVEFFGGWALIAGLLTRIASLGLASTMAVAILQVHMKQGFFNPGGIEFPMSLLGSTLLLAIAGAGAWSLDALIGRRDKVAEPVAQPAKIRRAA